VDSQTFWPVIWKKIAESFYQDKINPSLEYKILFTPVDTSVYSAQINPTGESPDPNNPVDFGILDDTRQFGGIYDSLRVQVIDTLILLFTGADLAGMPQQNDSTGLTVFYPAAEQNAGFDRFSYDDKYAPLRSTYPVYTINGQTGYLSYKSVKTGVPDVLNAVNTADSVTILYKKDDGTPVNVTPLQGDTVQLTVTGSQEGEFDLISYYESGEDAIETGRIRVAAYQNKPLNLVLVPVNSNDYNDKASESEIRNKLNKIYGQAAVTWTVSTHPGINIYYDSDGNPTFDCMPDQYQNYTTDMQHAIDVLAVNPPQNTYYLFILDQADSLEVIGLMPFLQPYGFVFLNGHENENELVKTIAHELGHGAFGLEHEFFLYPTIGQGDPNLMTWHPTDGSLRKYQWDWIQNPYCMIDGNCGQGITEAMIGDYQPNLITIVGLNEATIINAEGIDQYVFLDPTGHPFKKEGIRNLLFNGNIDFLPNNQKLADGSLQSFIYGSKRYNVAYRIINSEYNFVGYYYNSSQGFQSDNIDASNKKVVIGIIDPLNSCIAKLKEAEYINPTNDKTQFINVLPESGWTEIGLVPLCNFPEIHFATSSISESYINYFKAKSRPVDHSFHEDADLVQSFVDLINTGNYHDNDIEWFGDVFADKIQAYESESNGSRKFIILPLSINILSVNQASWNELAENVFEQANLSDEDILITIPYVHCPGYVNNIGYYFFMPGIAKGEGVEIDFYPLKKDYINTIETSNFVFNKLKENDLGRYINEIYKQTAKPHYLIQAYLDYRGDLYFLENEFDEVIGNNCIYEYRVTYDKRLDIYVGKVEYDIEKKPYRGMNSYAIEAYSNNRLSLYNFTVDYPIRDDEIINHGLFESVLNSDYEEGLKVYEAYALWFRYHKFSGCHPLPDGFSVFENNLSDNLFIDHRNEYIYQETRAKIDALGIALAFVNLDIIADIIGTLYAGYYGDWENVSIYSSSLLIPIATGGELSLIKQQLTEILQGQKKVVKIGSNFQLADNIEALVEGTSIPHSFYDNLSENTKTFVNNYKNTGGRSFNANNEIFFISEKPEVRVIAKIVKGESDESFEILDDVILNKINQIENFDLPTFNSDLFERPELLKIFADDVNLIDAWKVVRTASDAVGIKAWSKHIPLLNKVDEILQNPALLNRIGGEAGLEKMLKTNYFLPYNGCNACTKWLPNIEDVLNDVIRAHNKWPENGYVNQIISNMKKEIESFSRGSIFELQNILKKNSSTAIMGGGLPNGKYYDFFDNGVYSEFKSTKNVFEKIGVEDYDQFRGYLQVIDDFGNFELIFHKAVLKNNLNLSDDIAVLNHIKTEMKKVFQKNNYEVFYDIWDNQKLRKSLWGDSPPLETVAFEEFKSWVNISSDKIYKCIKYE
jgi:hypothetical protein